MQMKCSGILPNFENLVECAWVHNINFNSTKKMKASLAKMKENLTKPLQLSGFPKVFNESPTKKLKVTAPSEAVTGTCNLPKKSSL